jgi:hypothetical protein
MNRRLLASVTTVALGTSLVVLAGCAPIRDDAAPGAEGSARMAVLDGQGGSWDIVVMDMTGNILQEIDANLGSATSLTYHVDDYFLVSDGSNILRVDWDGTTVRWNEDPMPSVVYRMAVTGGGTTTVAEEYDVTEYDDDGYQVSHTQTSSYCWMDASVGDSNFGGNTAVLDICGPTIATWDPETGEFTQVATRVGEGTNVLGQDGSGNYYAASQYQDSMWFVDRDGTVEAMPGLASMGITAYGVKAIEPAGPNSVFALYDGNMGSGVVELANGTATELVSAGGSIWIDMTVF